MGAIVWAGLLFGDFRGVRYGLEICNETTTFHRSGKLNVSAYCPIVPCIQVTDDKIISTWLCNLNDQAAAILIHKITHA
jgi:hypothetical protein